MYSDRLNFHYVNVYEEKPIAAILVMLALTSSNIRLRVTVCLTCSLIREMPVMQRFHKLWIIIMHIFDHHSAKIRNMTKMSRKI